MAKNDLIIKIKADTDKAIKDINQLQKEFKGLKTQTQGVNLKNTEKSFNSLGNQATALTSQIKNLVGAYLGFQAISGVVNTVADIEEGFIGVAKTTGLAGAEFAKFQDNIKGLASNLAGVKVEELQAIAQTAGQLGIQGVDNLSKFTETIAKIAIATDLTADEASSSFARLSNILGEPIENVERLGSVTNELSNTTSATARDITEFALRIGGAGRNFGIASSDVLAFSATLRDVGLNAELGGTNFSKFLTEILSNTEDFAKQVGVPLEEFRKTIEEKPVEAINLVLQSFAKLDKYKRVEAFENLKLSGSEIQRVIGALTDNIEKMNVNLDTAKKEMVENTSLQKEYEVASKALNAQIDLLKNNFIILVNEIGKKLIPLLNILIENTVDLLQSTKEWGSENTELIKTIGEIALALSSMLVIFRGYAIATTAVAGLTTAIIALRTALLATVALNPPLLALVAVLGSLAYAYTKMSIGQSKHTDKMKAFEKQSKNTADELQKFNDIIQDFVKNEGKQTTSQIDEMTASMARLYEQNQKDIFELQKKDAKLYANEIANLENANKILYDSLLRLSTAKPFEEPKKQAKEYQETIKKLSEDEIKNLQKTNIARIKDNEKTLKDLEKKEKDLSKEIINVQKDLQKTLANLESERVGRIEDIESKIRDIKRGGLTEEQAYYDTQKEAEQTLYKAKEALRNGDLEAYKRYSSNYENLVTRNAGSEIKVNDQIKVSAEQTRQSAIQGLENLKSLENQYYAEKKSQEQSQHNFKLALLKVELQATLNKAKIEQMQLEATKKLFEALSGKSIDIDTKAGLQNIKNIEAEINILDSMKVELDSNLEAIYRDSEKVNQFTFAPKNLQIDTNSNEAKSELDSIQFYTLNNKTLEVTADTTPADFGIEKLIATRDGSSIMLEINPEYTKAQSELDNFRSDEESDKAIINVDADTKEAQSKIKDVKQKGEVEIFIKAMDAEAIAKKKELQKNSNSEHDIRLDVPNPNVKTDLLKNTSSTHTIFVQKVQQNQLGGLIENWNTGGLSGSQFKRRKGSLGGYGGGDKIPSMLEAGEFIIRKEAVKAIGINKLYELNSVRKYATGGLVLERGYKDFINSVSNGRNIDSGRKDFIESEHSIGIDLDFTALENMIDRLNSLNDTLKEIDAPENFIGRITGLGTRIERAVTRLNKGLTLDSQVEVDQLVRGNGRNLVDALARQTTITAGSVAKYNSDVEATKKDIDNNLNRLGVSGVDGYDDSRDLARLQSFNSRIRKIDPKAVETEAKREIENEFVNEIQEAKKSLSKAERKKKDAEFKEKRALEAFKKRKPIRLLDDSEQHYRRQFVPTDFTKYDNQIQEAQSSLNNVLGKKEDAIGNIDERILRILERSLPKFHTGGRIEGSGEVPIMALGGETVLNQRASSYYGDDYLNALNNLSIPKFQVGGYVDNVNSSPTYSHTINLQSGGKSVASVGAQSLDVVKSLENFLKGVV